MDRESSFQNNYQQNSAKKNEKGIQELKEGNFTIKKSQQAETNTRFPLCPCSPIIEPSVANINYQLTL